MLNQMAISRAYENGYVLKSKRIYARLEKKSDEVLQRYNAVLQPKGFINSFLALFNADRQLKINCLEDILDSRENFRKDKENLNKTESQNTTTSKYKEVDIMTSDHDMKLISEPVYKGNHPLGKLLTQIISRGYRK
jgi:hypothetical protein